LLALRSSLLERENLSLTRASLEEVVFSKGTAKPSADLRPVLCFLKASAKLATGTYFQDPDPTQYCCRASTASMSSSARLTTADAPSRGRAVASAEM